MQKIFLLLTFSLMCASAKCEQREELIPFGDMENWANRIIEESNIIGGNTKTIYEVAPKGDIIGREAYYNLGGSPWASSNIYAKVSGVHKTNCSVFPVQGLSGTAAQLITRVEEIKVLGMINISAIAAGSLFLGSMVEPIHSTKDPQSKLNSGISYTKRPKAMRFDYKVQLSGEPDRVRMTGLKKVKVVEGMDKPIAILLLQKRWEDSEGVLHAERIGTAIVEYHENTDWQINATYPIIYGDATKSECFTPNMALGYEQRYALNSEGENVPIIEEAWANENETPTHIILHFASSHGGAYIGSPGTEILLDNIRLVY